MAEKIKLNKTTLREQTQALKLYREFLPTLELRKQQLQAEVQALARRMAERSGELGARLADARSFAPMLAATLRQVKVLVAIDEVRVRQGNIAGVRVPLFQEVRFRDVPYSLLATPPFFDEAIAFWRDVLARREELRTLERQRQALELQLVKTTQRINLYEKVLIPEARENIRRIKVALGDRQTAAVCRAKLAKRKLTRGAEERIAAPRAGGAG